MTTTTGQSGPVQQEEDTALVLPLEQATDPAVAGRKAATLATLRAAGFPVPAGAVVPATVFSRTLAAAGEGRGQLDVPEDLAAALAGVVERWPDTPLAVRSSGVEEDGAAASYAGLYTTVLDVRGRAALLDAVRRCWASAFSARVSAYRQAQQRGGASGLAVLVQPMLRPEAAGVAFTADPVTGERDVVVVDAVAGVADALAAGEVTPQRWAVRGEAAQCADPAEPPVLGPQQAVAVARLARQVERHTGQPQDVEWAVVDGTVWLLQARPITALPEPPPEPVEVPVEVPEGFWIREDSHSALPWTTMTREVLAGRNPALRWWAEDLGLLIDTAVARDIGGWEYLRIVPVGGKEPPPLPSWLAPIAFRVVPALRRQIKRAAESARQDVPLQLVRRWPEEWRPELSARIRALRDTDLTVLDDTDLDKHLQATLQLSADGFAVHFRLHGALFMLIGELAATCRELLGWDDSRWPDLVSGTSVTSTAPARALARLAGSAAGHPAVRALVLDGAPVEQVLVADVGFAAEFAAYQREFGTRALCYELAEDCLDERPELVLGLLRDQLSAEYEPAAQEQTVGASRRAATDRARAALADREPADRDRFETVLARALEAYPVREDNEFFTVSAPLALVRRAVVEAGTRLVRRGQVSRVDHVFHLTPDELRAALAERTDVRALVARRRGERAWVLAHPGPPSYGRAPSGSPPLQALPQPARRAMEHFMWTVEQIMGSGGHTGAGEPSGTDLLRGIPASPGTYTGPVRVIRTEAEFDRLRPGDVLVCPVTSPVWSVLFPNVGALVTDAGGLLSHPAIIAREYAVPAVVATGDATARLHDGQLVTVDGTAGVVRARS